MRVLAIAPHPDDEVLGCGATLKRLAEDGHETRLVVLTNRVFPRDVGEPRIDPLRAHAETENVCAMLGIESFLIAGYSDKELPDRRRELIALFEAERDTFRPNLVLIPDEHDTHQDHRATFEAARVVWRPHLAARDAASLWAYQAPSSYGFVPNQFVRVGPDHVEAKVEAMKAYTTEVLPWPSTRCDEFIRAQATYWGGVTQLDAAEPFRSIMGVA